MTDPDTTRAAPNRPTDGSTLPADPNATRSAPASVTAGPAGLPTVPRYELVRELGRGGMGVVYEARQVGLNRTVALKMILAGAHAGPDAVRRFRAEAEAVARLRHPNVVQIYDIDEADGLPFFALEFVPGGTLEQRLSAGPLPVADALRTAERLAAALAVAHAAGIVHRDLKPANVLVAEDGTPKVTDFGLALALGAEERTATGAVLGTPNYMAPEQAEGRTRDVGPATDVWAVGAVLYAMLTGRPPFKGDSVVQTLDRVRFKHPEPPRRVRPDVPAGAEAVCLKCLSKKPADRYPTADALAADLARVLGGRPPLAAPRPHRGRRTAVVASVLLLLAAAGVAVALARRGENAPPPAPGNDTAAAPVVPASAPTVAPPASADRPPMRSALLVGIREYHGPGYDQTIKYAERDVEELARVLNERGFERRDISVLTQWNQEENPALAPTGANIRKRLARMADARPGDTVVVALAGHGFQTGDPPQFYFWPAGANPKDPTSLISQQELYAAFDRCRADVKLLLVDACREFPKDAKFDIKVRNAQTLPKEPARFAAFYSCSSGQICWELDQYKHGLFFYHLIDALRGAGDADRDGAVSLSELVRHTAIGVKSGRTLVEEAIGQKQEYFQTPELVGDLEKLTAIGGRRKPDAVAGATKPDPKTIAAGAGVGSSIGAYAPNLFGD